MRKVESKVIKELERLKLMVTYARLECCICHETYYVLIDDPRTVLIPDFISEGECFTSECPICEVGLYAMFITYIESANNKEIRNDYSKN